MVDVNEFHKSFRPIDSFIMKTAKIAIKIIDIPQLSWLVEHCTSIMRSQAQTHCKIAFITARIITSLDVNM